MASALNRTGQFLRVHFNFPLHNLNEGLAWNQSVKEDKKQSVFPFEFIREEINTYFGIKLILAEIKIFVKSIPNARSFSLKILKKVCLNAFLNPPFPSFFV